MSFQVFMRFIVDHWILSIVILFFLFPSLSRIQDLVSGKSLREAKERELKALADSLNFREETIQRDKLYLAKRTESINEEVRLRTLALSRDIASRDYLKDTPAFQSLLQATPSFYSRFCSVLTTKIQILSPFDISAQIKSSSGKIYQTSLYKCTCPDFSTRKIPCKHMIRLAMEVGLLFNLSPRGLSADIQDLLFTQSDLLQDIEKLNKEKRDLAHLLDEKQQSFPWLVKLYDDCYKAQNMAFVDYLRNKPRPALTKASEIEKKINAELSSWRSTAKHLEYQLHFYETLFPWLTSFKEIPPVEAFGFVSEAQSAPEEDHELLRKYLSPEEYAKLPPTERFQLALDRYIRREKNSWEVGIEYERYIGYLCEKKGYSVKYNGAIAKLEDMGRDLILEKGSQTILVQCKRWAKGKVIHENHVFQLAGSVFEYQYRHPEKKVSGAFVTTVELSPIAIHCADRLDIQLFPSVPFQEYPRIKCNVGKNSKNEGVRIFHLPMDQQYDNVKITEADECYVSTVAEAEAKGFRRAYRWHGGKEN